MKVGWTDGWVCTVAEEERRGEVDRLDTEGLSLDD